MRFRYDYAGLDSIWVIDHIMASPDRKAYDNQSTWRNYGPGTAFVDQVKWDCEGVWFGTRPI